MSKTLPIPLPGSNIYFNPASLQLLKDGQYGVRIRFNARGDHWQMLDAPQNGGPVGGFLVIINNPEAVDDVKNTPNVLVINRVLPAGTCAFGELNHNPDFPDAKPFITSADRAHTTRPLSDDAVLQAAYDRKQEARKRDEASGRYQVDRQQVRRRTRIRGVSRTH